MTNPPAPSLPNGHLQSCPRRNRRLAICAFVVSLGIALASVHGIARPFPEERNPGASQLGLSLIDAVLLSLFFLRFKCRHERLWLGTALAGGLLILLGAFLPGFGGTLSTAVNVACLVTWLAATVISVGFLRSAFQATSRGRNRQASGAWVGGGEAGPRCPACGSPLASRRVRLASHFRCPACSAELSVCTSYRWQNAMVGLVVAGGIATLLGPTRLSFAVVCLAAWLPATLAVWAVSKRLFPPRCLVYDPAGHRRPQE